MKDHGFQEMEIKVLIEKPINQNLKQNDESNGSAQEKYLRNEIS